MLEEIKKSYFAKAQLLPNWQSRSVTDLANGYIDASDPDLRDAFFAALVCHYWYNIKVFNHKNKGSDIPLEECYTWLIEGLQRALSPKWGQRWRDPSNKLYKDPNAVDKTINRCLASVRAGWYQDANRAKRKANYLTDSLEQYCDDFGDYYLNLIDSSGKVSTSGACYDLIQEKFQQGKYLEALILDEICYQDCFKNGSLNKRKMVADFRNLNSNYLNYLCQTYSLRVDELRRQCKEVDTYTNSRLHRQINRVLKELQKEGDLIASLCY